MYTTFTEAKGTQNYQQMGLHKTKEPMTLSLKKKDKLVKKVKEGYISQVAAEYF